MKVKAFIIIIVIAFWLIKTSLPLQESDKVSKDSGVSINTQQKKSRSRSSRSRPSQKATTTLASIKNEYLALNIPLLREDLMLDEVEDEENGAFYLKKAFSILDTEDKSSAVYKLLALSSKSFAHLSFEEKEQLAELFNDSSILEIFDYQLTAAQQEQYNWSLNYAAGFNMTLEHLSPMKKLHEIQNLRISYLLSTGEKSEAFHALKTSLKTAGMTSEGNFYISALAQDKVLSRLSENIQKFCYDQDVYETLSKELETSFSRQLTTIDGERIFVTEKAFEAIENTDQSKFLAGLEGDGLKAKEKAIISLDQELAHCLESILKARQLIEDPKGDTLSQLKKLEKEAFDSRYLLTENMMPSYSKLFEKQQAYQASLKMNLISQKLKEYHDLEGQYPESLDQLHIDQEILKDSLSDGHFNYEKKDGQVKLTPKTDFGIKSKKVQLEFILD